MQSLWLSKKGWDEPLEPEIIKIFRRFVDSLPSLNQLQIPRWIGIIDENSPLTLIGFSDASEKGYAAVVYLVHPTISDKLILLCSKTRVAPIKKITLPRLELCGAVLLSELLKWCTKLLNRQLNIYAFTDSEIVLCWLRSHPSRWPTFIANRTSQILEWMHSRQWYYVNTKINPADMASRGMLANELVENNLWWHGPKLTDLKFKAEHDISADNKSKAESEMKKPNCFLVKNSCNFLVDDISSHFNHKRVFKNICKFISIIYKRIIENKGKQCDFNDRINPFKNYEYVLLQLVQISEFQEEINCIKSKLPLPKTSSLRSLNPFLDGHDILRVGGRLQNSTLSFSQKHPIILPYGHQVTKNIIREAHENLLHGGLKLTASYIRNRFYIVRGLRLIKSILNGCIKLLGLNKIYNRS